MHDRVLSNGLCFVDFSSNLVLDPERGELMRGVMCEGWEEGQRCTCGIEDEG